MRPLIILAIVVLAIVGSILVIVYLHDVGTYGLHLFE